MADTEQNEPDAALDLMAALVQQSSDQLAYTTNAIIDGLTEGREALRQALYEVLTAIEAIPAMTRTVYLDNLVDKYWHLVG